MNPISIFFFAHQDDEFAVFSEIENKVDLGYKVYCIYMTDGGARKAVPILRNKESISVLLRLGVEEKNILFTGEQLGIEDGKLPYCMKNAYQWIDLWISKHKKIDSIYVPAWEGGHQDHDALHAIVVYCLAKKNQEDKVFQFSLYRAAKIKGPLFHAMSPLKENGKTIFIPIIFKRRLAYVRLCLCYPSQIKTWLALFPFVAFRYLFSGVQALQKVNAERLKERPHQDDLYYEKRGFFAWREMQLCLKDIDINAQAS